MIDLPLWSRSSMSRQSWKCTHWNVDFHWDMHLKKSLHNREGHNHYVNGKKVVTSSNGWTKLATDQIKYLQACLSGLQTKEHQVLLSIKYQLSKKKKVKKITMSELLIVVLHTTCQGILKCFMVISLLLADRKCL